jgi:F-type H+-transporting ATPase subunit b
MDIDVTLLLQLGLFLLMLTALNGLLFKPFLGVLDARYEKLHGLRDEADKLERDAQKDIEVYEARLREARDTALRERELLVTAGREEERRLLALVRADIAKQMNDARKELGLQETAIKKSLSADTEQLAKKLIEKVLGREVGT